MKCAKRTCEKDAVKKIIFGPNKRWTAACEEHLHRAIDICVKGAKGFNLDPMEFIEVEDINEDMA